MVPDRLARGKCDLLGVALLQLEPLLDRPALGEIAVRRVVGGGLVGDERRFRPAGARALEDLGQDLRRVAEQADRHRTLFRARFPDDRKRLVERVGALVEVAGLDAHVDARGLALDREHRGAGHRRRKRLGAAHAAEPGGENPLAGPVAPAMLAARFGEGLVGALHDALAADVDPGAGGHLAVHHQAFAIELVEVLPRRPLGDQVRVGDQHARRVGVRAEHADRLAGLDEQGLIVLQPAQGLDDAIEGGPVARGLPDAAVDDEILGPLGDLGIEVVLDHPQRRFGEPALRAQRAAARSADHSFGHCHTLRAVSSMTSSLRHCSSSVRRLPAIPEAKPHCGLSASWSSGRNRLA